MADLSGWYKINFLVILFIWNNTGVDSHYVDPCTYTNHIDVQIEQLVNVCLNYHTQDGGNSMPIFLPSDELTLDGNCLSLKNIELVDIFSKV